MDVVATESRRRVIVVKRRNWLIATLAALFVLQTPLCVLACQLNAAPDEAGAEAHHASSCHEEAPSPRSSSEPRDAHGDCGCGDSYTAVLASADQTVSNVQSSPVLPPTALEVPLNAVFSRTTKVQLCEADLPPPDILLLKSTLLI
jgi:hypothetical protein